MEPEYRYVKGEGWVMSYGPVLIRVKEDEVRVGDVIVGWSYQGRKANPVARYLITSIENKLITGAGSPSFSHHINGTVDWFDVER